MPRNAAWPSGPTPDPSPSPESPAAAVLLAYLGSQRAALAATEPLVRRDEPEAVHDMRIAVRRIRGALRSCDGLVEAPGSDRLAGELGWFAELLGAVRDIDIVVAGLREQLSRTPDELLMGPVRARITGHFAPERAAARAALVTALDSPRCGALLDALDRLLAEPSVTRAGSDLASASFPGLVARCYRRLDRRMDRALRTPAGPARDAALHDARKAAKRARYAAEVARPVFGGRAKRFARRMKRVQRSLGEQHDAVVIRGAARTLGVRAQMAGESAFTYGLLYERHSCDAAAWERRALDAWTRASRRGYRSWAIEGR